MTGTLRLIDYDSRWPQRFTSEATRIREVLGARVVTIEHVGSTAVEGLLGKPVLDIAIAVRSEADADACIGPLGQLGYTYRGQHGEDPRRRYYVLDRDGRREAQIHLYILPATAWVEKLAFRDALRSDPSLARAYAAEKQRVADIVGWDKYQYSIAKGSFVQRVLAQLRADGKL